jgi:hypothetical protein
VWRPSPRRSRRLSARGLQLRRRPTAELSSRRARRETCNNREINSSARESTYALRSRASSSRFCSDYLPKLFAVDLLTSLKHGSSARPCVVHFCYIIVTEQYRYCTHPARGIHINLPTTPQPDRQIPRPKTRGCHAVVSILLRRNKARQIPLGDRAPACSIRFAQNLPQHRDSLLSL